MQLTVDTLKKALPAKMRNNVSQALLDEINTAFSDPELLEQYQENVLSYVHVMQEGRFKMQQYLDAVKYVGFKVMGDGNTVAYAKTFPARYQQHIANGTSPKDIASYTTSYNKNKLVNLIFAQTLIPTHILNAPVHQDAINTLVKLMKDAGSEKVQCDAAGLLLTHLKAPEVAKVELDINVKEDATVASLRAATREYAKAQQDSIKNGVSSASELAGATIIEASYEEVEDE